MTRSQALLGARLIGVGRVLFGAAMVAKPAAVTTPWLGDVAKTSGAQVAVRGLGIRDLMLGALALHTVNHPQVGPRYVAACAVNDAVDLAATLAGRRSLPDNGVVGTVALAGGIVAASLYISRVLQQTAPAA